MCSPDRRSIGVAVLLTLLLAISAMVPAATAGRGPTSTTVAGIDVDQTTIPQLRDLMDRNRLTSVQLTQFYLHRISKLNPTLNAVITVSPTALADARAADRARRQGDDRPLLGIPIIVKDNINTTGMPTTAGSWALAGSTPADAEIIEQLKAAGAIIIGKANLSEWANFRSAPSSSGWSGIGGQTNMAHVLDRNPCGSSSGSGVAAAADLAVAAVGTETDGSVVCPSGANGVVGIKPTVGLLSGEGIVPITSNQDTAGPIARNVTDAAVLLGAMNADPTDYTAFLDDTALEGARIGVWREGTFDPAVVPEVGPILDAAVAAIGGEGAITVPVTLDLTAANENELTALLCEFKTDIETYLTTYTGPGFPKTLQDLIDFHNGDPREGPWNSLIFELAQETGGRDDPDCQAARTAATEGTQAELTAVMAANDLDAIVALTNGPAWVTNSDPTQGDLDGDFSAFVGSSTPAAVAGWAAITVPAGAVDGVLPIGVSFMGGAFAEGQLIGFAYDFEQATQARVLPGFLPTLS